jgi:hypothetical protein
MRRGGVEMVANVRFLLSRDVARSLFIYNFEHAVFGLKSYFYFRLLQQIKRAETDMSCSLANGLFKSKMDIDRHGPFFLSLVPFPALFLFILYFPYETYINTIFVLGLDFACWGMV